MFRLMKLSRILAIILSMVLVTGVCAAAQSDKSDIFANGPVLDPVSDYLSIQVASNGRFNSGGTKTPDDPASWYNISYSWPSTPGTSYTTVMVDGTASIYGDTGLVQGPTEDPSNYANTSIGMLGEIEVKQTIKVVAGSSGLLDTGMYEYTITNTGTAAHDVGLRIMIDTMLKGNDGAPFRVPGVGAVTTEMEFLGADVPQYWQAFYSLDNSDVMSQGTLSGAGATTPDRFILAYWNYLYNAPWDYTVNSDVYVTSDSATAAYWNPDTLSPGESRTYITYYGLGEVSGTADFSLTAPTALTTVDNQWSPNPFVVTGYISNSTSSTMTDVPVTIALPSGLQLESTDTATHTISSISPNTVAQTSWNVVPVASGDWTYSASAIGQTVTRQITVPVLDTAGPDITITSPTAHSYPGSGDLTISYSASDAMSGIASVTATLDGNAVHSGDVLDLHAIPGNHTLIVVASDTAGNVSTSTVVFSVAAAELTFHYLPLSNLTKQLSAPTDSVVDSQGNLYITDYNNNRIVKFDSSGAFVAAYGTVGNGIGQFNKPSGIAIDDSDNLYITDTYNNRVVRFNDENLNGTVDSSEWLAWGSVGSGSLQFNKPMGVYIEGNTVYVADTYNNRICVFTNDSTGSNWQVIGSKGTAAGQFVRPYDIVLDSAGNIFVSDTGNSRVQKLDHDGVFLIQYTGLSYNYGISIDSYDTVYVAERQNAVIKCIHADGTVTTYGGKGNTAGKFTSPVGVNVQADVLWIVDVTSGKIQFASY